MSRRFSSTALVTAVALPLTMLAALGAGLSSPATATGGEGDEGGDRVTFTVGWTGKPDNLNPFMGIVGESYEIWALAYDYLVSFDQDMELTGSLATDWELSEDGRTWTFTIRDDAVFSDGEPLTADDVAYTYNEVIDGGPGASWQAYLGQVTGAEAPDPTTVVLTLSKPNAVLPYIPIPIVPEHVWSNMSDQEAKSYTNAPPDFVGSGAFRVVEANDTLTTVTLEKNPDYWGDVPIIDRVILRNFKTEDTAAQALRSGEIDFVNEINGLTVDQLEGAANIETHVGNAPGFDEIAFNTGSVDLESENLEPMGNPNPAVLDAKFRYALGFAMDRELIADQIYAGLGTPGDTIVPAGNPWKWDPPEDVAFSYDPVRAEELLDEAGYLMGVNGFRTLPSGEPIGKLKLFARSSSTEGVRVIDYFSEWLADVGIDSEVSRVSEDRLIDIILDGTFDVFEWGWLVDPDPDSMLAYMTCGQRGNWSDSWYCDEQYDAWYEEQKQTLDPEARAQIISDMQEKLFMDAPYLVTVYSGTGEAYRSDRFEGFSTQGGEDGPILQQYGSYNYSHIKPVSEEAAGAAAEQEESDRNSFLWILVGGVVLLALVGGGIAFARSRGQADRA